MYTVRYCSQKYVKPQIFLISELLILHNRYFKFMKVLNIKEFMWYHKLLQWRLRSFKFWYCVTVIKKDLVQCNSFTNLTSKTRAQCYTHGCLTSKHVHNVTHVVTKWVKHVQCYKKRHSMQFQLYLWWKKINKTSMPCNFVTNILLQIAGAT